MLNSKEYLTFTQHELEKTIKNGNATYSTARKYRSTKGIMLLNLDFGSIAYDVASYNMPTQTLTITRPLWFIPPNGILIDFVKLCERKRRETF